MRESQEVERLRPALPPRAPPFRRKAAELDQARLIRVQSESELGQPLPKVVQERSRRPHILKATTLSSA
jgi:hypothetical protein